MNSRAGRDASAARSNGDVLLSPFWLEGLQLRAGQAGPPPPSVDVAVVGGGYTGFNCALTLARAGQSVALFEGGDFGSGASTRSGGQVSGGVTLGKSHSGQQSLAGTEQARRRLRDASEAMTYLERLIQSERIDCDYHRSGRIVAAWTQTHLAQMSARIPELNELTMADARLLSRHEFASELGSNYYLGGMLVNRAGHLNPAKLLAGLLKIATSSGVRCFDHCRVTGFRRTPGGFRVETARGSLNAGQLVMATNAYTQNLDSYLRQRIIPVASHIVATAPLKPEWLPTLLPADRAVSEHRRVLHYYRKSPDGTRLVFGGRTCFFPIGPAAIATLLKRSIAQIFPELRGVEITHCWQGNVAFTFDLLPRIGTHDGVIYCVGCNGSGVTLMSYLGHMTARKILAGSREPVCAFDDDAMPSSRFYRGSTWFLPIAGTALQMLDVVDRQVALRRSRPAS